MWICLPDSVVFTSLLIFKRKLTVKSVDFSVVKSVDFSVLAILQGSREFVLALLFLRVLLTNTVTVWRLLWANKCSLFSLCIVLASTACINDQWRHNIPHAITERDAGEYIRLHWSDFVTPRSCTAQHVLLSKCVVCNICL